MVARIDDVHLSSLGLSRIRLFPQDASSGTSDCPTGTTLWWAPGRGRSVGQDQAASHLGQCDKLDLRFVVLFSRFEIVLTLKEGVVSDLSPIAGALD